MEFKNTKGQYIIRSTIKNAATSGGYTFFSDYKSVQKDWFPKVAYSKYIPKKDMILTTGFYIEGIINQYQQTITKNVHNMLKQLIVFS